jgi:hypothetical protein
VSDSPATSFPKVKYKPFLLFILVLALMPFIILSSYIHPVADDLSYALKGDNFWHSLLQDYQTWTGRYSSDLFAFLNYIVARNIFLYQVFPILLILLLACISFLLLNEIFQSSITGANKIFFTLLFTLLILIGLPEEAEGLYWFTGSVTYVLPVILLFADAMLLIRYFRNRFVPNRILHLIIVFTLTIFIAGFNEVMAILLVVFSIALIYFLRNSKSSGRAIVGVFFFAAVIGFIAIAFAPGNSVRIHSYPGTQLFFHSFIYSLLQVGRFLLQWLTGPMLWIATLFYLPVALHVRTPDNWNINRRVILILVPIVIFCCVFPAYWGTGILGQHRTLNTAYLIFIPFWFFSLHLFSSELKRIEIISLFQERRFANALIVIFILALFFTGNALTSWSDLLSEKTKEYDLQMSAREQALKECAEAGMENCTVSLLSVKPQSIFVLDLQKDSTDWSNDNYAKFYRLKTVSIK